MYHYGIPLRFIVLRPLLYVCITYDERLFRTEVLLVWKNLSENQMVASLKDEE